MQWLPSGLLEKADGKKIFVWHLNGMENMPCGAAYNNDEKRLWPGEPGDCLDHKRYADTLKKIGFEGDVCTMEVFRRTTTSCLTRRISRRPLRLQGTCCEVLGGIISS